MKIALDLTRDLPKVRKAYKRVVAHIGACAYTAPCAVGVMMSPRQRRALRDQGNDETSVSFLVGDTLTVPPSQEGDFTKLQAAFDSGKVEEFDAALTELESKYLTEAA